MPLLPRPDSALFSVASFCSQESSRCSLASHYRHFVVSKGGFLNLLQVEVLVLAPGQELQVLLVLSAILDLGNYC